MRNVLATVIAAARSATATMSPEEKRKPSRIRCGNLILVDTGKKYYEQDRKGVRRPVYIAAWQDPSRYTGAKLREIRKTHR